MVRQEVVWSPPCQKPQLLDDLVSWHRYNFDSYWSQKICVRFILPARKTPASGSSFWESNSNSLRIRCCSITSWPCLEDNPLKRVKNFAFACGKIEDLPSLFCSLSFNPLRQPANYAESRYGGKCQDKRWVYWARSYNRPKEINLNPWLEWKKQWLIALSQY